MIIMRFEYNFLQKLPKLQKRTRSIVNSSINNVSRQVSISAGGICSADLHLMPLNFNEINAVTFSSLPSIFSLLYQSSVLLKDCHYLV